MSSKTGIAPKASYSSVRAAKSPPTGLTSRKSPPPLHLLQASLVYVNTRMLQTVLAEPKWAGRMTPEDYRGLTPLIYSHVNPYGRFDLDLDSRIDFGSVAA